MEFFVIFFNNLCLSILLELIPSHSAHPPHPSYPRQICGRQLVSAATSSCGDPHLYIKFKMQCRYTCKSDVIIKILARPHEISCWENFLIYTFQFESEVYTKLKLVIKTQLFKIMAWFFVNLIVHLSDLKWNVELNSFRWLVICLIMEYFRHIDRLRINYQNS